MLGSKPQIGARLLTRVDIKAEIARRVEEYLRTAGITVVDVPLEMKAIGFSDLRQLFDDESGEAAPPIHVARGRGEGRCRMDVYEERDNEGGLMGYTKKIKLWGTGSSRTCSGTWAWRATRRGRPPEPRAVPGAQARFDEVNSKGTSTHKS
jgi:hypothetical protein